MKPRGEAKGEKKKEERRGFFISRINPAVSQMKKEKSAKERAARL